MAAASSGAYTKYNQPGDHPRHYIIDGKNKIDLDTDEAYYEMYAMLFLFADAGLITDFVAQVCWSLFLDVCVFVMYGNIICLLEAQVCSFYACEHYLLSRCESRAMHVKFSCKSRAMHVKFSYLLEAD